MKKVFIIERRDEGMPTYWSIPVGRNFGATYQGWANEIDEATTFGRHKDAQDMIDSFPGLIGATCTVRPHQIEEEET